MITKESNITTYDLVKTDRSFIQIPFDTFEQKLKHTINRITFNLSSGAMYQILIVIYQRLTV